jgi:hypothetical protein
MPKLIKTKEDQITMTTMEVDSGTPVPESNKPPDEEKWEVVPEKGINRNSNTTFEQPSKQYLPANLPNAKQIDNVMENKTSYVLPLSIKLTKKWKSRSSVNKPRLVVAIIQAMQNVFQDTYLATVEDDKSIPTIINVKDIPTDDKINQYLATPINSQHQSFHCKIIVLTNHTIQEYKADNAFFEYIQQENIVMEINDLDDINPGQVGFLENVIPRYDTLEMHTNRLRDLLPRGCPKFQLHIQSLFAKTGEKTRIIMIKADDRNVDELRKKLNYLHKANIIK